MIDGVVLGTGRNDKIRRIYTTRGWDNNSGYEYSFTGNEWISNTTFSADIYCSSPVISDLKKEGTNSLYLGGWNESGVLMLKYKDTWTEPKILPESKGKGIILAMLSGNGRNDGINRLYVAHWSDNGLIEYSWNGSKFIAVQLMNKSVGRFSIGRGRNDGINRIYAVERGGSDLHEFTWTGKKYVDKVIFTGSDSNGTVYVADGRGDRVNRLYVWSGSLFELTYQNGQWTPLVLDKDNVERYYIISGSIRKDNQPGVYVSVKKHGLYEYIWSKLQNKFNVDVITGATGGCCIGDGRGDGRNRLYVANGTKKHYSKAAVVEISDDSQE